jgi:hypothetical protein
MCDDLISFMRINHVVLHYILCLHADDYLSCLKKYWPPPFQLNSLYFFRQFTFSYVIWLIHATAIHRPMGSGGGGSERGS